MLKFAGKFNCYLQKKKKTLEKVVEMLVVAKNYFRVLATGARTVNVVSQSHYI